MSLQVASRLMTIGMPVDPYRPNPADRLGLPDDQTLLARWDPFTGKYLYYPDEGELRQGLGYFVRPPAPATRTFSGRTSEKTPIAISLKPGWNLVSVPSTTASSTTDVLVTTSTQSISTWAEAAGTIIGGTFFRFVPDPTNPDNGTFVAGTSFQPGEAYYVRSLVAEGAVLVFLNNSRGRLPLTSEAGQRVASTWPAKVLPGRAATSGGWISALELRSAQGQFCAVEVGQVAGASLGWGSEDTPLPQGFGGFQMAVLNSGDLYRDIRPVRAGENYAVRIDGLKAGRQYTLTNRGLTGTTKLQILGLPGSPTLVSGGNFIFTASSATMVITVVNR